MNTDKAYAEKIASEYAPKETRKVIALKKLDAKAKMPANVFSYTFGVIMSLVLGVGMCLILKVIGDASIGYVFMAISLAIQGILQAYRKSVTPLFISLLRLIIIIVPIALIFINFGNAKDVIWWAFPITEMLTAVVSLILLKFTKEIKEAFL